MFRKIYLTFWCFVTYLNLTQAQELIANPNIHLSIDEELEVQILGKIGNMKSVLQTMRMSPEDIQKAIKKIVEQQIKEEKGRFRKVRNLHNDFFMIKDWEGREKSENQHIKIIYLEKANKACFRFDLVHHTQFIFTNFKPLEKGKDYKITIGYNFSKIPENHKTQPLGIFVSQENPEEAQKLKANFPIPFLSNQKQKEADKRRKKILEEYQKNYGGSFPENFAQEKKINQYLTQEFIYKAKGGETYLSIGRFIQKKKKFKPLSENLQCSIYWVSLQPVYNTRNHK